MKEATIAGSTIEQWINHYPILNEIISLQEVFWSNTRYKTFEEAMKKISLSYKDIEDAQERLWRFAPYIAQVFPETKKANGIIESPIVRIDNMKQKIEELFNQKIDGQLLLKCDSHLPISGSIKARGGIYEVLKYAEELAIRNNILLYNDDYSTLNSEECTKFFSNYSIAVGSTGNLGLSIGIISAQLGFKVYVHMSADAKKWKKDLLRSKGVEVIEHQSDYSKAVEEARKQAEMIPNMYFVDDENSIDLFMGYAVAPLRLKKQLEDMNIIVDENHPLFVYLPCGVGGGPGGVTFGLKQIFKDNVHCFFAEPTHSPCMLIGMLTELHNRISVKDFGIDNITEADGLAVGSPSGLIGKTIGDLISGIYTINDDHLFVLLKSLFETENIFLEPSALAGVYGPVCFYKNKLEQKYIKDHNLEDKMQNSTHIAWATGGSMVPKEEMKKYYEKALKL